MEPVDPPLPAPAASTDLPAPSLQGYGAPERLDASLRDPGHDRPHGERNDEELAAPVVFLRGLDPIRVEAP